MKGLSCQSSSSPSRTHPPKFTAHQVPIARNPVARSLRTQQRITRSNPGTSANRCSTLSSHPTTSSPMIGAVIVQVVALPHAAQAARCSLERR